LCARQTANKFKFTPRMESRLWAGWIVANNWNSAKKAVEKLSVKTADKLAELDTISTREAILRTIAREVF